MHVQNIKIYVLSLHDASERRASVRDQLILYPQLNWEFFDAITTDSLNLRPDLLMEYNSAGLRMGRGMTKGEIACAESHLAIWKLASISDYEYNIVLEDDFILTSNFNNFITSFTKISDLSLDILIIGYSKVPISNSKRIYQLLKILPIKKFGLFTLGRVWKESTCGTVGYLIKKSAAIYISNSKKIPALADDWGIFRNSYGLKIYHLRPLVVYENFENFPSLLEAERSLSSKKTIKYVDLLRYIRSNIFYVLMLLGL